MKRIPFADLPADEQAKFYELTALAGDAPEAEAPVKKPRTRKPKAEIPAEGAPEDPAGE